MQRNVLEYLEETVKRVPDKIAFANDKTQLTFQQFSDDIRAIGSELIRKGYQKESGFDLYEIKARKHW